MYLSKSKMTPKNKMSAKKKYSQQYKPSRFEIFFASVTHRY